MKNNLARRAFLKNSGLSLLPALMPLSGFSGTSSPIPMAENETPVNFVFDGDRLTPSEYIQKLTEVSRLMKIEPDNYGAEGCVAELEKKFEDITGKEKAIFMPTGTMANELAIHVLSGSRSKVFVQETSHVYRDEADAAQTIYGKRLIPLAKEQPYFSLEELKESITYHRQGEAFDSSIGAVSIETPVRRSTGQMIPVDELRKISSYCRNNGIPLHLDGARLFMASAWSDVSIQDYASLSDTVYISLYKYLGASSGAMLCGKKDVIGQMHHLMKVHGGLMYRNWLNAALPLYNLEGYMSRLQRARQQGEELMIMLNRLPQIKIWALPNGSNKYPMQVTGIDLKVFKERLFTQGIQIFNSFFCVNETILKRDNATYLKNFKDALRP